MNVKRFIGATIALFVFIFLYEWLVHGVLMSGLYHQTIRVWRDHSEMMSNFGIAMCFRLGISAWLAFTFAKLFKEGGWQRGLQFGIYFGVFAAILTASWYLWLPVPAKLSVSWFLCSLFQFVGGGLVLGSVYRK